MSGLTNNISQVDNIIVIISMGLDGIPGIPDRTVIRDVVYQSGRSPKIVALFLLQTLVAI